jgi:hypothetical protein
MAFHVQCESNPYHHSMKHFQDVSFNRFDIIRCRPSEPYRRAHRNKKGLCRAVWKVCFWDSKGRLSIQLRGSPSETNSKRLSNSRDVRWKRKTSNLLVLFCKSAVYLFYASACGIRPIRPPCFWDSICGSCCCPETMHIIALQSKMVPLISGGLKAKNVQRISIRLTHSLPD